jgi:enoyl-CoA hydratase/carnithine racemase
MAKWWRGVILQAIEARLRREPELNKLGPKVIEALARAAMRLVHGQDIRRRIVAKS